MRAIVLHYNLPSVRRERQTRQLAQCVGHGALAGQKGFRQPSGGGYVIDSHKPIEHAELRLVILRWVKTVRREEAC